MVTVKIKHPRRGRFIEIINDKSDTGIGSYEEWFNTKREAQRVLNFLEGTLKALGIEYRVEEIPVR